MINSVHRNDGIHQKAVQCNKNVWQMCKIQKQWVKIIFLYINNKGTFF